MATTSRFALVALVALSLTALAVGALPCRFALPAAHAETEEKPKRTVDAEAVYVGDAARFEKPAEVDVDKVYAAIDEYREIVEKGLKSDDPKYALLMAKASKRFLCAVKKAAKDAGYDLVARAGAIKGMDAVPDLTADAIAKL